MKNSNPSPQRTKRDVEIKEIQKAIKEAYDKAEKLLNDGDKKEALTFRVKFI